MTTAPAQPGLADRLREVVVSVRGDLDISRHTFRAGPSYIVRDPVTFASHRFDPEDYQVINAIRGEVTLGHTFEQLVASGHLEAEDEESFYAFVLDLHQRSLLNLPINDADTLYQRYERRNRAENIGRVLGVFFMKVPLFNPNQFLARTLPLFRWLFTAPGLFVWLLLVASAGLVVLSRAGDLSSPVLAMLDGNNMFMLVAALIGLKVVHEFGHAYACRSFGGYVPEMGVFLVLFTPLAYVDATDSWSFSKMHRRAIVTLGGVYFESIVGALAVFVWALTEPSTLNTLAYQVMILSTVTTALFNLNPLLRYDAYYLVSDLTGIPNLRARCQEAVAAVFKRYFFGIRTDLDGDPIRPSPGLVLFGLAQMGYRCVVMITISTVLVMKFGSAGIVLAVVLNGITIVKGIVTIAKYVLSSAEAAAVRIRAIAITAGVFGITAAGISLLPVPHEINANGVVSFEQVTAIRAPASGVLVEFPENVGHYLQRGESLALIENPAIRSRLETLDAEVDTVRQGVLLASVNSTADAMIELTKSTQTESHRDQAVRDLNTLLLTAPDDGMVLDLLVERRGVYVERGEPIIIFGSGGVEAVLHVNALDFQSALLSLGDEIICRSPAYPTRDIRGVVTRISDSAVREIESRITRAAPQGLVAIDGSSGAVIDPYFEIQLSLLSEDAEFAGSMLKAKLPAEPTTIAQMLKRRVTRFLNRVRQSSSN